MTASLLLEKMNIANGFIPVDLQTAANNGDYTKVEESGKIGVLFFKAVGTAGDDPTITITQAKTNAGGSAKALNFTTIYTKQGADLDAVSVWTKQTQTAANTYTDLTSAELAAMWWIEFNAEDLDASNAFNYIRAAVGDVGSNPQLGCLLYFHGDLRYPDAPENLLTVLS